MGLHLWDVSLFLGFVAEAEVSPGGWTKSQAERIVIKSLRLP